MLRALVGVRLRAGELDAASDQLHRLAELEPLDVETQRQLLTVLLRCGRRSEAARRYEVVRRRFRSAFGEEPELRARRPAPSPVARPSVDSVRLTLTTATLGLAAAPRHTLHGVLAVALAFASSLCWGTADFMGGLQSRRQPAGHRPAAWPRWPAVALAVALVLGSGDAFPALGPAALAIGAGAAGCAALAAFYRGLAIGTMSIVAPVSATGAAVPVLVGWPPASGRAPCRSPGSRSRWSGSCWPRASRRARASGRAMRAALGLALLAAVGFGSFFVLLDRATEDAACRGRSCSPASARSCCCSSRSPSLRPAVPPAPRDWSPLLLVGTLDVLANALFALATTKGLLSVVAVVGSLLPGGDGGARPLRARRARLALPAGGRRGDARGGRSAISAG